MRCFQSFAGRKTRDSQIGQGPPSMYRRAMTVPQLGRKGNSNRGANLVGLSPALVKFFVRSIILDRRQQTCTSRSRADALRATVNRKFASMLPQKPTAAYLPGRH
jgi:hypothetical protein